VLLQGAQGVSAGGIPHADFFGKGGNRGSAPTVVVAQSVEDVEGIFWLLTVAEGPELER
jgi:hypothetical protein